MSSIKPSRRWQPAFYPFHKEPFGKRLLGRVELLVKGPLFGCRMCGNCLLQETAFICPMECPKGMRNGPCGGMTPDKHCYIDITRKCIWNAIYERSFKTGRTDKLLEILPPIDWDKAGCETWGDVTRQIKKTGTRKFFTSFISNDKDYKNQVWDSVFKTVRQPDWWAGDSEFHKPPDHEPVSELERKLLSGKFVVATEVTPPLSSKSPKFTTDINLVKPYATAVNFTDASSARPRMSSLACSKAAVDLGAEPVFQIAARDITRTGLQGTVTGLNESGIRNVLCITGDSSITGPSPRASLNIVDVDSVQMLWILRRMRDDGIYLDGTKMKVPPSLFLGASAAPLAMDPVLQAIKENKKVNAGAQFLQSNIIFEPEKLDPWLEQLDKRNVLDKVFILIGLTPVKSLKVALHLQTKVPGVKVPQKLIERIEKAGDKAHEEGVQIVLEIIDSLKRKKGISGIHLMTLGWESILERIVKESSLY